MGTPKLRIYTKTSNRLYKVLISIGAGKIYR